MRVKAVALAAGVALLAAGCGSGGGGGSKSSNTEAAAPSSNCKPAHTFPTVSKGFLTVSARTAFPPYVQTNGNQISGVDGDIAKAIAKKECLGIKVFNVQSSAGQVEAVQKKHADIALGDIYRTKARAQVVALSTPLYLDEMAIISKKGLNTVDQLKGKSVGTVQGYLWADDLQSALGSSLKLYPNSLNMDQDLASGRLAAGVDSYGAAKYAIKTGKLPGYKVEVTKPTPTVAASEDPGQAGFLMRKGNDALIKAIDADVTAMHQAGQIADILKAHGLPAEAAKTGTAREIGG